MQLVGLPDGAGGVGDPRPELVTSDGTLVAPSTPPVGRGRPPSPSANIETAMRTAPAAIATGRPTRFEGRATSRPRGARATGTETNETAHIGQAPSTAAQHQRQAYWQQDEQ